MTEISLQRARVPPGIRLVEPAGVPKHVGVGFDFESSGLASSVNELLEVADRHRRAAFGHEYERRPALSFPSDIADVALAAPGLSAGESTASRASLG